MTASFRASGIFSVSPLIAYLGASALVAYLYHLRYSCFGQPRTAIPRLMLNWSFGDRYSNCAQLKNLKNLYKITEDVPIPPLYYSLSTLDHAACQRCDTGDNCAKFLSLVSKNKVIDVLLICGGQEMHVHVRSTIIPDSRDGCCEHLIRSMWLAICQSIPTELHKSVNLRQDASAPSPSFQISRLITAASVNLPAHGSGT
jgi:hypothetical protein